MSIPEPMSGCLLWIGSRDRAGYGRVQFNGRLDGAHRVSYELHKGPIPEGLTVDHLCRNRACLNPSHLEAVTEKENILRGVGVGAKNAVKTHCRQGHPYDEANTVSLRSGRSRWCLTCSREFNFKAVQKYKTTEKYRTQYTARLARLRQATADRLGKASHPRLDIAMQQVAE